MLQPLRATSSPQADTETSNASWQPNEPTYICTSVTADTVEGCLAEIEEATAAGVDVIELRLDFLAQFDPDRDLKRLMDACKVPYIVTFRPTWEGCVARCFAHSLRCAAASSRRAPGVHRHQFDVCLSTSSRRAIP
jgi:hypothetical protein